MVVSLCHCDSTACMAESGDADSPHPELARMEAAVQQLLLGVGEDPSREGLVDTPRRVAKAWLDMTRGYRQECKTAFGTALFHEPVVAAGSEGLVVVRDITFAALSEATLLPFHGRCHIAYVPSGGVVLGLSKLARVTKCLAARLQTQQQFAERLVAAVQAEVAAAGVAAVVQAVHLGRGPAPVASAALASCGCFARPASAQLQEFLALLRLGSQAPAAGWEAGCGDAAAAHLDQQQQQQQGGQQEPAEVSSRMAAAADTLLRCVGEDPARKGLKGGAARYARWLVAATAGYRMQLPRDGCAAELGPPTPGDHSPDPSDASSDDMSVSADLPCLVGLRETAAVGAVSDAAPAAPTPASQAPQRGGEGVQTFAAAFSSQCEHHLLPFYGRLTLAFLPPLSGAGGGGGGGGCPQRVLAAIVEMYARRLQVQERLTHQVADAVVASLGARAVLVVVESAHMCMVARGVEKHASTTLTTAARGVWAGDAAARAAAMQALLEAHPPPQPR